MALVEIPGSSAREVENKARVGMAGNEILGKRFIVHSDEILTAFLELERTISSSLVTLKPHGRKS
jgi:hypothetical protein